MKKIFSRKSDVPSLGIRERVVDGRITRFKSFKNDTDEDVASMSPTVCNVDQFSGQPFMLNSSGFIMNDIMMYEEAQSDSVARTVLQRIKAIQPSSVGDEDFNMIEQFERLCPSHFGSPAEYLAYTRKIARLDYERLKSLESDHQKKNETIDFTKTD